MIGGYILLEREPQIENKFKSYSKRPMVDFIIKSHNCIGWFFHNLDKHQSSHNVYHSNSNLLMVEGVAVTGNIEEGYRLIEPYRDFPQSNNITLSRYLEKIVSNVTAILVSYTKSELKVEFASHRTSGGRIWYIKIPRKGVILCDDLRALLYFKQFEIEPKAFYGILKYGSSPDPINIIKGIYNVPVSHFAICTSPDFDVETTPFFKFDFSEANKLNMKPIKDTLRKYAQFINSQTHSLLLSGGVDSTLLAHYLNSGDKTEAYFLSFGRNDTQLAYVKEAATRANLNLNIVCMEGNAVLTCIMKAAASYIYPFNDDSLIPTYFLMDHIKSFSHNKSVLVDGTGGDACFGFDTIAYHLLWKILYAQPTVIKQLARSLYDNGGIYKYTSKWQFLSLIINFLSIVSKTYENHIQLSPLISSPIESFFTEHSQNNKQVVGHMFLNIIDSCIHVGKYNDSFRAKATVGDILHQCRKYSLKTYRVGNDPSINTIYPYLWQDILIEQAKLSWSIKQKGRIVKWPLKKLLEEYMADKFVYRKKSGFVPPLLNWFLQDDIYGLLHDILLDPRSYINNFIAIESIRNLLHKLRKSKSASPPALFFLWGALFSELWLRENYHRASAKNIERILF